jgi:hypothetical protein
MNKKNLTLGITVFLWANIILFLTMASLEKLPTDATSAIFVDFWGRLCVYSLWYLAYALYRSYIFPYDLPRFFAKSIVCTNIPLFLFLGYLGKLDATPQTLPFIDFWGRVTVYSLWFIAYELYLDFMGEESDLRRSIPHLNTNHNKSKTFLHSPT